MVRVIKDLDRGIEGRHVLFVEDIIDTGLTLGYLLRLLGAQHPASLQVCTLLNRPARRIIKIESAYKDFDLPDAASWAMGWTTASASGICPILWS